MPGRATDEQQKLYYDEMYKKNTAHLFTLFDEVKVETAPYPHRGEKEEATYYVLKSPKLHRWTARTPAFSHLFPLHRAIANNDTLAITNILKILPEAKEICWTFGKQLTPLEYAITLGNSKVIALLKD
jgi:hypothetical protein